MSYSPWDTSGPSQIAREGNFYLPGYATKKPPRRQVKTIDLAALKAYRDERHTFVECAQQFDSSVHIVKKMLKGHPVKVGLKVQVDIEQALKLRSEGWSTAAIARELQVSERTLHKRIGGVKICKRPSSGKPRQLRMTDEQYATYLQLGGGKWLRSVLSAESTAGTPPQLSAVA